MSDDLRAVVERHEEGGWTWWLTDGALILRAYAPHAAGGLSRRCARRQARRALNNERFRREVRADPQREEIR